MSIVTEVRARRVELDRLRGLAILCMIADHVAIATDYSLVRVTVGRVAVPVFFIVAGHLAGRLSWRHVYVLGLGLALPVLVPWVDSPNVLLWWVVGSVVLWVFTRLGWGRWSWLLIVLALTFAANGWAVHPGALAFDPVALVALMALGRLLLPAKLEFGARLPSWFAVLGRWPLCWYVGHVLALQVLLVALGSG